MAFKVLKLNKHFWKVWAPQSGRAVGRLRRERAGTQTQAAIAGALLAYRTGPDQDVFTTNQITSRWRRAAQPQNKPASLVLLSCYTIAQVDGLLAGKMAARFRTTESLATGVTGSTLTINAVEVYHVDNVFRAHCGLGTRALTGGIEPPRLQISLATPPGGTRSPGALRGGQHMSPGHLRPEIHSSLNSLLNSEPSRSAPLAGSRGLEDLLRPRCLQDGPSAAPRPLSWQARRWHQHEEVACPRRPYVGQVHLQLVHGLQRHEVVASLGLPGRPETPLPPGSRIWAAAARYAAKPVRFSWTALRVLWLRGPRLPPCPAGPWKPANSRARW